LSLFFAEERQATPGWGSGTIINPYIQNLWGEFCVVISLIFSYLRLLAYDQFRMASFADSPHNGRYAVSFSTQYISKECICPTKRMARRIHPCVVVAGPLMQSFSDTMPLRRISGIQ